MSSTVQRLFSACRSGDLTEVQHLVEVRGIHINVRDSWDSTPLYYACLCGHFDIVRYLVQSGATCQPMTFDGERCLYGALTDKIRQYLLSANFSKKLIDQHSLQSCLRRLYEDMPNPDIVFDTGTERIGAHRFLLTARCPYFNEMLKTKWKNCSVVSLNKFRNDAHPLKLLLRALYTAHLELDLSLKEKFLAITRKCGLTLLHDETNSRIGRSGCFQQSKPGVRIRSVVIDGDHLLDQLKNDLSDLAIRSVPHQLRPIVEVELPFSSNHSQPFADICFLVGGHRFLVHRAIFAVRSDYFAALFRDHFHESSDDGLTEYSLAGIDAQLFREVVYFVYSGCCSFQSAVDALDMAYLSEELLLADLRNYSANYLCSELTVENCIDLLRASRLLKLGRLEYRTTGFIANHLAEVINNQPAFVGFVVEDAETVKERQETDSIQIIDDIRYHINSKLEQFSDIELAKEQTELIDGFLAELGLDA